MKRIKSRSTVVKLAAIATMSFVLVTVTLLGNQMKAGAASAGPSPSHTNAPGEDNCSSCHASYLVDTGTGSVQISGVPANYVPGQPVQVTVAISQDDAVIYGFQITAIDSTGVEAGIFSLPAENPAQMQIMTNMVGGNLMRQYVEHTTDGLIPTILGTKSWTFTWTAPSQAVGKVDFYVAGNAANSDSSPSGDYIYTKTVSSIPATSFSVGGRVVTPVGNGLRNAIVTMTDSNGITMNTLTNSFGFYSFPQVPGGQTYTLRVSSKRYRFASQVVTVNSELTDVNFTGLE